MELAGGRGGAGAGSASVSTRPAAPETLTERAWRLLEEEIILLRLAPGSVVSEALLSERLGIGRTPVREALQRLAREQLVVVLPRRGIVISELDVARQLRLMEVRRELERLLAVAAARKADPEQRQAFNQLATQMEESATQENGVGFMQLDRAFNLLLQESARNEFASAAINLMSGLARRFWYAHFRGAKELSDAVRLHAEVARAVASGDEAEAARASDRLMDYVQEFIRRTVLA